MSEYVSGLEDFLSQIGETPLSTGSPELDELIGGVRNGMFYFFYCKEKELIENFFQHLVVNALKPNKKGLPLVVYMLCGNYRKERTNLGLEELAELVDRVAHRIGSYQEQVGLLVQDIENSYIILEMTDDTAIDEPLKDRRLLF